jgi:predicted TPR repeat methyltransferase
VTLPGRYFDQMYESSSDPWGFSVRWYEERKRAISLAVLPEAHYATAYEPGCSIGVLTDGLASRCDALLASDVSEKALALARKRIGHLSHVTLERHVLPRDWPDESFDLVVLSEVLYYFENRDLATIANRAAGSIAPGGTLVSIHWLHPVSDYPQSGDTAQDAVSKATEQRPELNRVAHYRDADFDLLLYVRAHKGEEKSAVSVAARESLC